MRPSISCICKYTSPVHTNTRFIILMHPMEFKKIKNGTGHMTNLQLANSEIIVGVDFSYNKRVNEILNDVSSASFLLYPGKESFNLSSNNSKETVTFLSKTPTLFILDGTWPCARKMLKLSTNLQKLKRVSFDNTIKSKFIIKQQPDPLCLGTIESVFTVLNILKQHDLEDCDTTNFLLPFEKMIDYQVSCTINPPNESFRSSKKRTILPKDIYKDNGRNFIFEKENTSTSKNN